MASAIRFFKRKHRKGVGHMAACYYICDENTPGAERFRVSDTKGKEEIWLVKGECPEPLYASLSEEAGKWMVEEYYTEDDDHGDAFRYFYNETINHDITVENAIVKYGAFAGALYKNKLDGSPVPVLVGRENYVTGTDVLNSTHDLDKQSHGRLIPKDGQ
jgi:hypothetical protein